ncbi:MAG: DNA methyltransferase [Leadbetterella sp.]
MSGTIEKYIEFLERKKQSLPDSGFDTTIENSFAYPFQSFIVKKALKRGKYAVFADCGLGKTLMQLLWAQKVVEHTLSPVIVLCPLAVANQTIQEGEKFGIKVRKYDPSNKHWAGIMIANYEQLDNIDTCHFSGVVLDESSILKNFEGKIKQKIVEEFSETPYKIACTATPSPNDPMEIGNHAEFLDVMSRNQMLSMYFVHDGGDTAKWRIKKHAEKQFWQWVSSWAIMLTNPSDIGFPMQGYDLPTLNFIEKQIKTEKRDNGRLFNDILVSATTLNQELRLTKVDRINQAANIVNESNEPFIIWVKQDEEAALIMSLLPDAVEVSGSMKSEVKESRLLGFAKGEFRVLVTKTKIAQFGLNYQHCRNQIFCSLDFGFEGLYQAIRRSYRFGQKQEVNIYIITTDTMQNVMQAIKYKQNQFDKMQKAMSQATNQTVIALNQVVLPTNTNDVFITDECEIRRGDCVQLIQKIESESIGFSIFSPPFAELYTYSDQLEDMGNSKDYDEFFTAFNYLVPELFRVLWSGRNVAVHCMDLPIQKGKEGYIGLRDFSGMIRETFEKSGFIFHSRVTIWKDPVTEMQRTKALGLLHKQVKKDSAMSRVGIPDYLLVFRKPGEHNHPVKCDINVDTWQKYASPVWMDINYSKTLNGRMGREENDEKHIAPLQLETIERSIHLWSNQGDTVFSPFAGIGSELYQALKMKRKAIGFELKQSYFDLNVKNCKSVLESATQHFLF